MKETTHVPVGPPAQLRAPGNRDNYETNPEDPDGLICKTCKSQIMAVQVHHPIWDGPFPMSGSGRVHITLAPYCPQCEYAPSERGSPIKC